LSISTMIFFPITNSFLELFYQQSLLKRKKYGHEKPK
jgi:hypothetical protein